MTLDMVKIRPRKKKPVERPTFDLGTPERRTKGDEMRLEDADAKDYSRKRLRVLNVSPLDRAHSRGEISEKQWHAGIRFQSLWQRGHVNPLMAINLNPRIQGGSPQPSAETVAAQIELRELCREIGQRSTSVLMEVVCMEIQTTEWASQQKMIPSEGLGELRTALNAVAHVLKVQ